MTEPTSRKRSVDRGITAADVGRFLKLQAAALRDPRTGNPRMAQALTELASKLIAEKFSPVEKAAQKFMDHGGFEPEDDIDFSVLSIDEVRNALTNEALTRGHLIILGTERFGIARSRLEKLSREEIVRIVSAANHHEESLGIISEEARRGGQSKSS